MKINKEWEDSVSKAKAFMMVAILTGVLLTSSNTLLSSVQSKSAAATASLPYTNTTTIRHQVFCQ